MKQTIQFCDFQDAFVRMDRTENFSYEGKRALFDYLEELEQDMGEELELDIIALCCDYTEDAIEDVLREYGLESIEELEDNTQVIWNDGGRVLFVNY